MNRILKHAITVALVSQCFSAAYATPNLIAVGRDAKSLDASISPKISTQGTTSLSTEHIELSFNFIIPQDDVGLDSSLFIVAKANGQQYMLNEAGIWSPWDGGEMVAAKNLKLTENEHFTVLSNQTLPTGEYQVFAGYQTKQGEIKYTGDATNLIVFDSNKSNLHAVTNPDILRDYLFQGIINKYPNFYYGGGFISEGNQILFSGATFSPAAPAVSTTAPISTTNLQEAGVDEGDRIKTDKDVLFSLRYCESDEKNTCLHSYRLQPSPAKADNISQLTLTNETEKESLYGYSYRRGLGSIYLAKHDDKASQSIVWLKNKNQWSYEETGYQYWKKYNNHTDIKFITADQPEQLAVHHELTIEGELLSSRMINGVLYLLTRSSTYHSIPWNKRELNLPIVKPPVDFFLPTLTENQGDKKPLVKPENCYIPPQNGSRYNRSMISVLIAIPVDNPSQLTSRCITGDIETFYASTQAIYLATSRYPTVSNGNWLTYAEKNHTTDIHKFSLDSASMNYLGSGQVEGHLGWEKDKKSFRFGEDNNTLRVATSLGSNWSEENPTRTKVTVLEEDKATQSLKEIGKLDHLGKPGEKLYAARFLGDRGYLVTFRTTDPLIVLDLSQANDPKIIGELEVNGYSDYLHPIGDNYLLGIGKDAIPAPQAENGDSRGAFFQGVKLSLFDVSSAENLREVDTMVIGKRGTDSTVLRDHHGLTVLETDSGHYKLALPIELHENNSKPYQFQTSNPASIYYSWTNTGLYTIDINTTDADPLQLSGKLISDNFLTDINDLTRYSLANDRSVIQGDTVHYIHGDKVLSSEIKDLSQ